MDTINNKTNSTMQQPANQGRVNKFPIKAHKIMLKDAFVGADFPSSAVRWMSLGIGFFSDVVLMMKDSVHLDNHKGNDTMVKAYRNAIDNFHHHTSKGRFLSAGVSLHTIGDFYAHSNYIDLYSLYARERHLSLDKEDIPVFSKIINDTDFLNFAKSQGELRTGSFGLISDLIEKIFKTKPKEGSHTLMNLDSNKSFNGGKPYAPDATFTKHEASVSVAFEECKLLLQRFL